MAESWSKDDASRPDAAIAYRKLKRVPDHFVARDPVCGCPRILNGSLRYQKDGMSVYFSDLMDSNDVTPAGLCSWDEYGLGRASTVVIRLLRAGVLASVDEDDEDEKRGASHGLVRTDSPPPDKNNWREIRDALRRRMQIKVKPGGAWFAQCNETCAAGAAA